MRNNYPPFFSDCIGWPPDRIEALHLLIDEAEEIDLGEFSRRIGAEQLADLARGLGYAVSDEDEGIRLSDDYHVGYRLHRETGIPFLVHSAIEHVYATPEEIDRLNERAIFEDDQPGRDGP